MQTTSYDEADKCPKCKQHMKKMSSHKAADHEGKIFILECDNRLCRWYQETKLVQVLPNGEVPIRERGEKEFVPLSEGAKAHARAQIENVQEMEQRRGDEIKEIRWT